jgi:hypothetical protein
MAAPLGSFSELEDNVGRGEPHAVDASAAARASDHAKLHKCLVNCCLDG